MDRSAISSKFSEFLSNFFIMSIGSGSIQGGRHLEVGGLTARERRQITLWQSHSTPQLARRDVDQHEVHGPAAKPVFRLCRPPGRQHNFMAVVTAHPRAMLPLVLPQRWPTRPPPRLCGAPVSCCASSQSICSMAPIPAVRQKRSKELSTSCQAVSRLGASASDEGVVSSAAHQGRQTIPRSGNP